VDVASKTLSVTKFATFTAGEFSLKVRVTFPGAAGTSGTFKLTSYTDTGKVNLVDVYTGTTSTTLGHLYPNKFTLDWNDGAGNPVTLTAGTAVKLHSTFRPSESLTNPATTFEIKFSPGWSATDPPTATIQPYNELVSNVINGTWTAASRTMSFATTDTFFNPSTPGGQVLRHDVDNFFKLTSDINLPSVAGTYTMEVVFMKNGAVLN
jgi:hypothetical protein